MSRIIYVPQYPSEMRYQEWWFWKLSFEFSKRGFEVITLGDKCINSMKRKRSDLEMFSPIDKAIEFEAEQIKEYMELKLRDDDILFWSDLSFPGVFGHVLFHKRPKKMFAFCHGTSRNFKDYYESNRYEKWPIECGLAGMFDVVFVGSKYHKAKLGWNNAVVSYLPFSPIEHELNNVEKTIDIISASRPTPQKVNLDIENEIEKTFNTQIKRPVSGTWFNYHWNLNSSKILLSTASEETFGYQIVDAVTNNCIPLAPRKFAYPELLPDKYLYSDIQELGHKIDYILNSDPSIVTPVEVPHLLCEDRMNDFYDFICDSMILKTKEG